MMIREETPRHDTEQRLRQLGVASVVLNRMANASSRAGFFVNLSAQIR